MPEVSIILPVYNGEKTIAQTVRSVLKQSMDDFELIVVNDGSTDESVDRVLSFTDARIKLHSFSHRKEASSRNMGMKLAKGRFIAFIDHDDLWTPDKLAMQVDALLRNPGYGAAYSWVCLMDEHGRNVRPVKPVFYKGDVYGAMLQQCFLICGSNWLLRREAMAETGYFNPTYFRASDWEYNIRVASRWRFALVPKYQVFYRQHPRSLSTDIDLMEHQCLRLIEASFQKAPEQLQPLKNKALGRLYRYLSSKYFENPSISGGGGRIFRCLMKALQYQPSLIATPESIGIMVKMMICLGLPERYRERLFSKLFACANKLNSHWNPWEDKLWLK